MVNGVNGQELFIILTVISIKCMSAKDHFLELKQQQI